MLIAMDEALERMWFAHGSALLELEGTEAKVGVALATEELADLTQLVLGHWERIANEPPAAAAELRELGARLAERNGEELVSNLRRLASDFQERLSCEWAPQSAQPRFGRLVSKLTIAIASYIAELDDAIDWADRAYPKWRSCFGSTPDWMDFVPPRDDRLVVESKVSLREAGSDPDLAVTIGAVFHHTLFQTEVATIEHCAAILVDFRGAGRALRVALGRQIYDEAVHATYCLLAMDSVGCVIGDYPVDRTLWLRSFGKPLPERLAAHQGAGEVVGIDAARWWAGWFLEAGAPSTADLLDLIAFDEVQHVRIFYGFPTPESPVDGGGLAEVEGHRAFPKDEEMRAWATMKVPIDPDV